MKLGGKIVVAVSGLVLTALVVVAVVDLSNHMEESNKREMAELVTHAQIAGFTIAPAVWAEDGKALENPRLNQGEIQLNVLVDGCSLELTRSVGARTTQNVDGSNTKPFRTGRVFLTANGQRGSTKPYPSQNSPTLQQVRLTLAANQTDFSCYAP